MELKYNVATFAGGCFWCTEAIFKRLKGVKSVIPGYSGGDMENPSYDDVSTGQTGHAEAVQITFDPQFTSYKELVDVFFKTHDPTQANGQGPDIGPQYRSIIFYHDQKQKIIAQGIKDEIAKSKIFSNPILTQIVPFKKFYEAEPYHKDYFKRNPGSLYSRTVINPKIKRLEKDFKSKIVPKKL